MWHILGKAGILVVFMNKERSDNFFSHDLFSIDLRLFLILFL